jgi:hypothetical protein
VTTGGEFLQEEFAHSNQHALSTLENLSAAERMGRKPNQLILEYFERGPKLEDASNRYQHTCKSCGEKVPVTEAHHEYH